MRALTYDDVLLVPLYNHHDSRRDVDISMVDKSNKLHLNLPIMSSNMDTITESEMAIALSRRGGVGVLHRFMSFEKNIEEFKKCSEHGSVFVSVGCTRLELERAEALYSAGAEYFCVDVAHAHSKYVGKTLSILREKFSDNCCIMAGNVCSYAGADFLVSKGADIVKVGIGPGSVCTTRIKTGFGVPQLTAIQECQRINRSIVADGGIRFPGDVVKALAFGADFVMIGGMFAGTSETPTIKGNKIYRGMASKEAAEDFFGGLPEWRTAEGVLVEVKPKGSVNLVIDDIVGGLRSGLTYGGSLDIRELQRKLDYVRITKNGLIESQAHKEMF